MFGSNGSLGMGCVLTLVDDFSANAATAESSMQRLGLSVDGVATRIDSGLARIKKGALMMGIGAALLAPFALAANEAAKFEQQLSSIKAVSAATDEQMQLVRKSVMEFGPSMGYSAIEAAQGVEELVKAGVDFSRIAKGELKDALNLARAGELSLEEAAGLASGALNAFKRDNLSLAQASNYMAGAANVSAISIKDLANSMPYVASSASLVGLSFKDVNTSLAMLGQNYIKGSQAGTTFSEFLGHLKPAQMQQLKYMERWGLGTAEIVKGHDGMRSSIGKVTSVFYDQTGKIKGLADIAQILQDKFGGLSDLQRASEFQHLFGEQAVRAAVVLYNSGAKGVNEMAEAISKVTAEQVAMEKLNNLIGQWSIFKAEFQKTAIIIGTSFLPILRGVVKVMIFFNDILQKIAGNPLGELVLKLIAATGAVLLLAGAFAVVKGGIMVMWATALPALVSLWAALAPLLPVLIPIGAAIAIMVKGWSAFGDVLRGSTDVASGWLGFLQRIGGALKAIGVIWNSWDGKTFNLGGMEDTFQKMGILEQMKALGTWVVRLKELFGGMIEMIVWGFDMAKDMVKSVWNDVIEPLFDNLGIDLESLTAKIDIFKNIGRAIGLVIGIPLAALGLIFSAAMAIISTVSAVVGSAIYYIGKAFGWLTGKIMDFFTWFSELPSIWEVFSNIGSNLANGIYNGLVTAWTALKDTLLSILMAPFEPLLAAIDYVAGTNYSGSIGQLQPALSSGNAGKVNQMVNYNNTMKAQPQFSSSFIDKTVTNTEVKEVNLHLDGDLMYKHMVKKGDLDNARN
jgi:TP901 family phage tail tape measure protein